MTASSKRKLEELGLGNAGSSASSADSQVREARHDVMEGSIERGVMLAQTLDSEGEMREHGSNDATDADAMREDDSGWSSPVGDATKALTGDTAEAVVGVGAEAMVSEAVGKSTFVSSQAGPSAGMSGTGLAGSPSGGLDTKGYNSSRLQFFVKTYIQSRTVVIHAAGSDSIESVHQQIFRKTGLPVSVQGLLFGGRQLQHDQTLASCNVVNDATLVLGARMRSTSLPHSWQLVNDLVATVPRLCAIEGDSVELGRAQDAVRASVMEFLKMGSKFMPFSEHMRVFDVVRFLKMRSLSVKVSEHMRVFELAGATSALVMLLLSGVESNRECAEESIKYFLRANAEYLPPHIHSHCASVLLEFCKLLAKSTPKHSLYTSCRTALARLLDTVGIAHRSPYFGEATAESIVRDFAPFVNELSVKLAPNLEWISYAYATLYASIDFTSYVKDAWDFTAFVIPLCKAMEVCKGGDLSGSTDGLRGNVDDGSGLRYSENMDSYRDVTSGSSVAADQGAGCVNFEIGSHGWLRLVFLQLLVEMDHCLEAVGGAVGCEERERPLSWAPFLLVLKGLYSIAKLYEGAMEDLTGVLSRRDDAFNLLIRQSRWQDDDEFWLLENTSLLEFESKRRLVLAMLPQTLHDQDERLEIVVHRSQVLAESFEMLAYVEPESLKGGISVKFAQEEATGPGVLREWFSLICREIFNSQNGLFLPCPKDPTCFFPNPASGVNPGHLTYFRFCGRVIALALMHKVPLEVAFAETFFKQLAGLPIYWEDAEDDDPVLYERCKKLLEMDPEAVDSDVRLKFVIKVEKLGIRKVVELCQGGRDMVVNSANRRRFVELLVRRRLVVPVVDQIKSFARGFDDLLVKASTPQFLRPLETLDLEMLLKGEGRTTSLEYWRRHTEVHGYMPADE